MRAAALALAVLLAAPPPAGAVTPEESALLSGAISRQQVIDAARAGDAGMLRGFVASRDSALIEAYGSGIDGAMTRDVEAIVIAHFNDRDIGPAIRAMSGRYRTRQLFDLYAKAVREATFLSEPAFGRLLQTDQEGIEEEIIRLSARLPPGDSGTNYYVMNVALRRHPAALPYLFDALGRSFSPYGNSPVLEALLAYPSRDVWLRTAAELESQYALGRLSQERFTAARGRVQKMLDGPEALERQRAFEQSLAEFGRRRAMLPFDASQIERIRTSDPAGYVERMRPYLEAQERLAREVGPGIDSRLVAGQWMNLGSHARFRLRDAAVAVELYRRAATLGMPQAQLALADALQVGIGDPRGALIAYRRALSDAGSGADAKTQAFYGLPKSRRNVFWQEWLRYEISYLEGKARTPTVSEEAIGGFFEAMLASGMETSGAFDPALLRFTWGGGPPNPPPGAPADSVWVWPLETWQSPQGTFATRPAKPSMAGIPPSRFGWKVVLPNLTKTGDAQVILEYMRRSDPSGYWSACALGTVAFLQGAGEKWKEEAVRSRAVEVLPGLLDDDSLPSLSQAARGFLAERGLAVRRRKP